MSFERAIDLLKEFDYEKNGELNTIRFLIWVVNELINGKDVD